MIDKPLSQITKTDLEALIADGKMEGKRIEYKRLLDIDGKSSKAAEDKSGRLRDETKRKFLASIASFANASGGDMVFGIEATDGKPIKLVPLEDFNSDAIKLRLQQMIRSNIEPKVMGIDFREVQSDQGYALVIRIPKSYSGLHMVTFNDDDHFYTRGENGRLRMDVEEIATGFTLAESVTERMRKWRVERIANIIVHVLPLAAFGGRFQGDMLRINRDSENLKPINAPYGEIRLDFDGLLSAPTHNDHGHVRGYNYVFRNGCIESVDTSLLDSYGADKLCPAEVAEFRIKEFLERSIAILQKLECEAPFFIGVAMLNVKGFAMYVDPLRRISDSTRITRDHLIAPEIFVESYETLITDPLSLPFNMFWNACGYRRSPNYNDQNQWKIGRE